MHLRVIWKRKGNYSKLLDKTASRILFEIDQIDFLLESYAELLERVQKITPDLVETTALASVIHSFYNGIENIFSAIAKEIDGNMPAGFQWHRDLLLQMMQDTVKRKPVVSADTAEKLADYLAFRHFYRHAYSFFLDWEEIKKLVTPLSEVWGQAKDEIKLFLKDFHPKR